MMRRIPRRLRVLASDLLGAKGALIDGPSRVVARRRHPDWERYSISGRAPEAAVAWPRPKMAQNGGIRTVGRSGALYRINERRRLPLLPPLGQWVPVSVLGSRIAKSLFGSRSVSSSGWVGSENPITDRTNQLRYEPLPHFTITATSARNPLSRWRARQM